MNCETARQALESRDSIAIEASTETPVETSATHEAELHVQDCANCQMALSAQKQLDQQMARVCREVPIPPGLKERLLASLAAARLLDSANAGSTDFGTGYLGNGNAGPREDSVAVPAKFESAAAIGSPRRRWFKNLARPVVAALLVFAGIGTWWWTWGATPKIALDVAIQSALEATPEQMTAFQRFRTGDGLKLPATMLTAGINEPPQQLADLDVAVYLFKLRDNAGRLVNGRLLVVPRAALTDPPTATQFLGGPSLATKLPYRTTAWVEGKLAFVCYVEGNEETLFKLRHVPA